MCGISRRDRSDGGLGSPMNELNRSRAKMFSISLSSNSTYSVEWDLSPLPKPLMNSSSAWRINPYYFLPLNAPSASMRSMTASTVRMAMKPIVSGLAEPAMVVRYQIMAPKTVIQRKKAGMRVSQHF